VDFLPLYFIIAEVESTNIDYKDHFGFLERYSGYYLLAIIIGLVELKTNPKNRKPHLSILRNGVLDFVSWAPSVIG
jgi:hypothetical protein